MLSESPVPFGAVMLALVSLLHVVCSVAGSVDLNGTHSSHYRQYLRWQTSLSRFDPISQAEYHKMAHDCIYYKENLLKIFWCTETMHNKIKTMNPMNVEPHWNRTANHQHTYRKRTPQFRPNCDYKVAQVQGYPFGLQL